MGTNDGLTNGKRIPEYSVAQLFKLAKNTNAKKEDDEVYFEDNELALFVLSCSSFSYGT